MNDGTKIVLGYDGSEQARDALRLTRYLARLEDAQVIAVARLPYDPGIVDPDDYPALLATDAAPLFDEVRKELDGAVVSTVTAGADYSAAAALYEVAEREGADVIVIGSTHRGKLGRVFPGSAGERLLSGAPCPIAIAPRAYADREGAHLGIIGIGYDGTDEANLALAEGETLARALDGELRLIAAVPQREEFQDRLATAMGRLPERLHVETVVEDGDPAAVLADQGVELDLLVIGSRGYGPLRRVLLGGVSGEVIRTAPCPVIVVPRGAAPRRERADRGRDAFDEQLTR